MSTWIRREHTVEGQVVEDFTGEGAYHGSTKRPLVSIEWDAVAEKRPTTIERYFREGVTAIGEFDACFPNRLCLVEQLDVPSEEEVRDDGVTFCWCPFEVAVREAGPLTRRVLAGMSRGIVGRKRNVYFDSKIQYFEPGDLPVDSCLRHVDESIVVRDERVLPFGVEILHDMRARVENGDPPLHMAYQSSHHCATGYHGQPLTLRMPELIPNFNAFDVAVRAARLPEIAHRAGAIMGYDGLTVHWATPATECGWRLWARCIETDREVIPHPSVIECYGSVFRPRR